MPQGGVSELLGHDEAGGPFAKSSPSGNAFGNAGDQNPIFECGVASRRRHGIVVDDVKSERRPAVDRCVYGR